MWASNPDAVWYPWLKNELENKGFDVKVPKLPETDKPRIQNWVTSLAETVGNLDEETYFIGHSIGCQTIARYLEQLPDDIKVGGVVFVAGFFKRLTGIDDPDEKETEMHWLETPIDLKKVSKHFNKSIAIFSDNDPFVPLDNQDDFKNKLGSEIIIEHNKEHFDGQEVPAVLEAVLKLSDKN